MGKKHNKHGRITRPDLGMFAKNEYAVMGTTCDQIKDFCLLVKNHFVKSKIGYLDANHNAINNEIVENEPFQPEYIDNIRFQQFNISGTLNPFQNKKYFNDSDFVLINGNHFRGESQVVILNPAKEKSLYKRRDQLTNVVLIIEMDNNDYFPPFLDEILKIDNNIPKINIKNTKEILAFFKNKKDEQKPPIRGLVLAGGKSTRMGTDKGRIDINGTESRAHFYKMLDAFCVETFISGRSDQAQELTNYPFLEDRLSDMGPFGAIITAFMHNPNTAWLIVATDLYQMQDQTIKQLVDQRNTTKLATAFINPATEFPDPLCTVWEPKSYAHILEFMRLGYSCPRKVLINSDVELITPQKAEWLFNVNTKEDLQKVNRFKQ